MQLKVISLPANMERIKGRESQIIDRLLKKIDALMIALQAKVVGETIPAFFPNGAPNIAATVRVVPAELKGTIVGGYVEAGGPRTTKRTLKSGAEVDYAAVQEVGVEHGWEILPFNKKALAFMLDGKRVFRKRVWHPGLMERPYLRYAQQEMEETIYAELSKELNDALNG